MKRATTINVSGQLFSIDEDAERALKIYLEQLQKELKDEPEKEEMFKDIEASIAEHMRELAPTPTNPVTLAMVNVIKERIGHISEDEKTEDSRQTDKQKFDWNELFSSPIYKNKSDKVIDGVCSGIAKRFAVDPLWIRLLFLLLLVLTHGFMVVVYFLLVFVMKDDSSTEVNNPTKKMTANAVVDHVKDEAKKIKIQASEAGLSKSLPAVMKRIGTIFARVARLVATAFLLYFIIGLNVFFAYVSVSLLEPTRDVPFMGTNRGGVYWVMVAAAYVTLMIPLIYFIVRMYARSSKGLASWFSWLLVVIWISAVCLIGSAIAIKRQDMHQWIEANKQSKWLHNVFVETDAPHDRDNDSFCISAFGACRPKDKVQLFNE